MKTTNPNSKKYKILLRILLTEFIILKILSGYSFPMESLTAKIILLSGVITPIMLLLYTVRGDQKFQPVVRTLAEIGMWLIGISLISGIIAEIMARIER